MRIGILTLPLHTNYGGILQAYALQTVLKRMGHEVVVIDTYKKLHLPIWKWPLSIPKRLIAKYLLGKGNTILAEYKYNKTLSIINQHTQHFIQRNISRKIIKDISEINPFDFDTIVVGSDQVWRPCYFKNMFHTTINHSFLAFAKEWKLKRIAYAASFGTEEWEFTEEETEECKNLAALFDAISVREDSGVQLCQSKLNVEATHVLDPTMLLESREYVNLTKKANTPHIEGNLLYYILDETLEKKRIIENISKLKSLIPFTVNANVYKNNNDINRRIQPPIEKWLRGFLDAEFIITDSFHACVFSIIFKKPFIAIGNKERGMSRFKSLLKMFELEERLISEYDDISLPNDDINWEKVEKILSLKKKLSFNFLKQHCNN